MESVDLPLGKVLSDANQRMRHVYFPTAGIVSLWCLTREGRTAEVAAVDREGMVGVSTFLGGELGTFGAMVQSPGHEFRLNARLVKDAFDCGGSVMHAFLRYIQVAMVQMTQTGVCNRRHRVDSQLSCGQLQAHDRLNGHDIHITQEVIARALGVRREGVTVGALKLQRAGFIR